MSKTSNNEDFEHSIFQFMICLGFCSSDLEFSASWKSSTEIFRSSQGGIWPSLRGERGRLKVSFAALGVDFRLFHPFFETSWSIFGHFWVLWKRDGVVQSATAIIVENLP